MRYKDGRQSQGNACAGKKYGQGYAEDDIGQYHGQEGNCLHIASHFKPVPVDPDSPHGSDYCGGQGGTQGNYYAVPETAPEFPFRKKTAVPPEGKTCPSHAAGIVEGRNNKNEKGHEEKNNGKNENNLGE